MGVISYTLQSSSKLSCFTLQIHTHWQQFRKKKLNHEQLLPLCCTVKQVNVFVSSDWRCLRCAHHVWRESAGYGLQTQGLPEVSVLFILAKTASPSLLIRYIFLIIMYIIVLGLFNMAETLCMFLKTPRISCFWGEHCIIFLFISKPKSLLCMQRLSFACHSSPDPPTARQRSWNGLASPWTTLTSSSFMRLSQWVLNTLVRHVRFITFQPFFVFEANINYLYKWKDSRLYFGVYLNVTLCVPGPDYGKSQGYGLWLVRTDIPWQEIKGKIICCWTLLK